MRRPATTPSHRRMSPPPIVGSDRSRRPSAADRPARSPCVGRDVGGRIRRSTINRRASRSTRPTRCPCTLLGSSRRARSTAFRRRAMTCSTRESDHRPFGSNLPIGEIRVAVRGPVARRRRRTWMTARRSVVLVRGIQVDHDRLRVAAPTQRLGHQDLVRRPAGELESRCLDQSRRSAIVVERPSVAVSHRWRRRRSAGRPSTTAVDDGAHDHPARRSRSSQVVDSGPASTRDQTGPIGIDDEQRRRSPSALTVARERDLRPVAASTRAGMSVSGPSTSTSRRPLSRGRAVRCRRPARSDQSRWRPGPNGGGSFVCREPTKPRSPATSERDDDERHRDRPPRQSVARTPGGW